MVGIPVLFERPVQDPLHAARGRLKRAMMAVATSIRSLRAITENSLWVQLTRMNGNLSWDGKVQSNYAIHRKSFG
ncbi:hypothetical protein FOXB_15441 [Fusarium oxysporum f. sp. conglutinans Fo5176]|uniref:Uncharacterized protein n=1 Tax=Fusarium oxysporum (strain Fo5176) TaxID=660025 RepID=F9G9V9_FUSOF|nr:hypothetical protein FOXB_15441 [Fusarium oxysporum f. sp. conglutinans Fo5176]